MATDGAAGQGGRAAHHADDRRRVRLPVRGRGRARAGRRRAAASACRRSPTRWRWPTRSASACRPRSARWPTWPRTPRPGIPLRWHFHNTRNTGYANAITAVERGAAALDASAGGIGGCPFAPAATGNIATEDLLYLLHRSGVQTGMSLPALEPATNLLAGALGTPVPGLLSRAGPFPG